MPKKFEVMKRSINAAENIRGFNLGGQDRVFMPNGTMYLSDAGEAQHIKDKYGPKGTNDVLVSEIPDFGSAGKIADQEGHKPIHQTMWTVPELPWKKEVDHDPDTE